MRPEPLPPPTLPEIRPQPERRPVEELEEARTAEQFTTVLMSLVVKEMFESTSVGGNGMFGSGPGSDIYRGFAQQAFAEALAKHGMDDLVDTVRESLARHSPEDPT